MPASLAFSLCLLSLTAAEACPAAADVSQRIRGILHLAEGQELSERFVVERHEAGLFLELRSADSTLIGQKTLPLEGSCDELSQAAAVVISAWLTDVHPDFASALPPPPASDSPPTEALAPEPALPAPPPSPSPPPPPSPPRVQIPRQPNQRYRLELGLGAGADLAGAKLALSGLAWSAYMPERAGLGITLWLSAHASRREPLGSGSLFWRRWPVGIGPSLRWSGRSVLADAALGPALAWLHLMGGGFSPSYARSAPTWAAFANLRLASRGKSAMFGMVSAQYYPGKSVAYAAGSETGLPPLTVSLFIGASVSP